MKKYFAALTLAAACLMLFCSCNGPQDEGISQLRTDILTADEGDYTVTVYLEEREIPLSADGKAGERTPVLIVKISSLSEISGTYSIFTTVNGKEYSAQPTQRTENTMRAEIAVEDLPDGELTLNLKGADEVTFTARTVIPDGTADYKKAVETARATLGTRLQYDGKALKGELFVRILFEEGCAYWYVGYVTEDGTSSLLISADGRTVIATHLSEAH